MSAKIRWGVLGAAKIAVTKVIPAMQLGEFSEVVAIASRDASKARETADKLGIAKAYGSYEELLGDPGVDAVYNPLPNHLHVPWSIRAAEAGKHCLCEKPVALNVAELKTLIAVQERTKVVIGEAFMVRSHPQWLRSRELVRSGSLGEVHAITGVFSYFNRDPNNVRNNASWGGGALMDIGCYPIQISRFILSEEPLRVSGFIGRDPEFGIDRLTSGLLEFKSAHAVFTCSTQMIARQKIEILGEKGRIEIEIPFNAQPERPTRIYIDHTGDLYGAGRKTEEFPACNQYTLQGDAFSQAILSGGEPPTPLSDSLGNLAVIDALFESARSGKAEKP
jgi:predicted dehydrogenase